ncbi:hypothetical protein CEXT_788541 [Caerostris extrusa]|uniref:Uncharacterized protein n=1 Tax=Caerostris extrusa TaxID=172846 RepID=A0AAV4V2D3_CAEEX|nr:hypothetical protein CEXT_788541 [Caerostris extrusa]
MAPPGIEPETCGTERQSASHSAIQVLEVWKMQLNSEFIPRGNLLHCALILLPNVELTSSDTCEVRTVVLRSNGRTFCPIVFIPDLNMGFGSPSLV